MEDPRNFERNKFRSQFYNQVERKYSDKILNLMKWSSGEYVMDYGCGPGTFGYKTLLPYLEKHDSTLYCVDTSEKVVDYASKAYPHPRINYYVGDILGRFPVELGKFDKIFAYHVFHCISDLGKALRGLNKVLKHGGKLAFLSFTERFWAFQMNKMLAKCDEWRDFMTGHESYFPTWSNFQVDDGYTAVENMLVKSGYRVVHLEVPQPSISVDVDSCLDLQIAASPFLSNIPIELQMKLKADMRKMITDLVGMPENSQTLEMTLEYVVGVAEKISVAT